MARIKILTPKKNVLQALTREIRRLERQRALLVKTDPEIIEQAIETLGSALGAALWLAGEQRFANGRTPTELARTPKGRREALDQLLRVEDGGYL